jgi:antitoxin component of MazEF toxin-antitoxin module
VTGGIQILTRVQKWDDSLAVRIPKPFAIKAGLEQDTQVDAIIWYSEKEKWILITLYHK